MANRVLPAETEHGAGAPTGRGRTSLQKSQRAGTRAAIQDAMLKVVAREGYAAATVENICVLAGITKATFYKYFDGKREAALAIVSTTVPGGVDVMLQLANLDGSDDVRTTAVVLEIVRLFADHAPVINMMRQLAAVHPDHEERTFVILEENIKRLGERSAAFRFGPDEEAERMEALLLLHQIQAYGVDTAVRPIPIRPEYAVPILARHLGEFIRRRIASAPQRLPS